jgi:hypothetical protein
MSSITVFTAAEALEAAKATADCFTLEAKKETKKYTGNSFFLNNKLKNIKHNGVAKAKADPWITSGDVDIPLFAVQDPSQKKKGTEDYKPRLTFKVSLGGALGEMIKTLQPQWIAAVNGAIESGVIPKKEGRQIHDLLKLKYSEEHPTTPGALMEDPNVVLSVDFGLYPEKYPLAFLQGKPKTTILDFNKRVEVDGKVSYGPATVIGEDGAEVPVNEKNLHLFIKPGSVLKKVRLDMCSTSVSAYWISCKIHAQELIIKPGGGGGFDDNEDSGSSAAATTTAPAAAATTDTTTPTDGANDGANDNNVAPVDAGTAASAIDEI